MISIAGLSYSQISISRRKNMVYEIRCSWCGKLIGTKEGEETEFAVAMKKEGIPIVSHSICSECKEVVSNEYGFNQGGKNNG
jgi:formylmethanofuran dehydrogenase subunit E